MAERPRGMGRRSVPTPLTKEEQEAANAEQQAYAAGKKLPSELLQEEAARMAAAPVAPKAKLEYWQWILKQTKDPKLSEANWRQRYNDYVASKGGRIRKTRKHRCKQKKTRRHRR